MLGEPLLVGRLTREFRVSRRRIYELASRLGVRPPGPSEAARSYASALAEQLRLSGDDRERVMKLLEELLAAEKEPGKMPASPLVLAHVAVALATGIDWIKVSEAGYGSVNPYTIAKWVKALKELGYGDRLKDGCDC